MWERNSRNSRCMGGLGPESVIGEKVGGLPGPTR